MGFYLLKAGSYVSGRIGDEENPPRYQRAREADNNIVESELDLASMYPEKFSYYDGPTPSKQTTQGQPLSSVPRVKGQDGAPPPGPPTDQDRAEAMMAGPKTVGDAKKQAQWHRDQADALEQAAAESERNYAQAQQQQDAAQPPKSKASQEAETQYEESPRQEAEKTTKGKIPSDQELHQMTKEDLKALTDKHQVEVSSDATKNQYFQALRAARDKK